MDQIQHMSQTIDDFRNFFRPDKEKTSFSIEDAISRTVALIEGSFSNQNLKIFSCSSGEAVIKGYPNEFCQALLNIIQNARDALLNRKIKDGILVISTSARNGKTIITIKDNAGGIPEEVMDKIFEPYFTTKGLQGTGIGLFMSKKIIEINIGVRITAHNIDSGAEFVLEFIDDPDTLDDKQIPLF
jgi:signal transduction histidine kinase